MARTTRIIAVTLGLSVAGAVFGALAGAIALALSLLLTGGGNVFSAETVFVLSIPAKLGGSLGAIGAPAVAWILLRRVPLGKAVLVTTIGTVTGGVTGWIVGEALRAVNGPTEPFGNELSGAILGAVAGFVAAALLMGRSS
jgi:hypothetical protein